MSVPKYDELTLPILQLLSDGKIYVTKQIEEAISAKFNLTNEDLRERLPSGTQTVFSNRIGWAKNYLKQAGLVEFPKRGQARITNNGIEVMQSPPVKLDKSFLSRFPTFLKFQERKPPPAKESSSSCGNTEPELDLTPNEKIELSIEQMNAELKSEILESIFNCSPDFFERLVVDLLIKMGYGGSRQDAGQAIGKSGDEGIDGTIKEDKLGLDIIYIQAKRWTTTVGRPEIQKFAGALQGKRAKKGVFITTSNYSRDARDFVTNIDSKIILIDGEELAELMLENGVGVSVENTFEIKKLDSDYFVD